MQVGTFHCETCGVSCSSSRLYCSHACAHRATQIAMHERQNQEKQLQLGIGLPPDAFQLPLKIEPG